MDAEVTNEVVDLVCIAVAMLVGVVGFAFAGREASVPERRGWHTPWQQVRSEHFTLARPHLTNLFDAMVDVPLIVFDAGIRST